jgi:hypothetical protein
MIMPKSLAIQKKGHQLRLRVNLIAINLHARRRKGSPAVGNVNPVAIRRNPAKKVNAKNRSPVPRKILRAKKEKNPVPIKKRTVLRKNGRSNFSSSPFFLSLKFLS